MNSGVLFVHYMNYEDTNSLITSELREVRIITVSGHTKNECHRTWSAFIMAYIVSLSSSYYMYVANNSGIKLLLLVGCATRVSS